MFSGLSIEHLIILLVAGLFILGPDRLPEAARWMGQTLRKIRGFAADSRDQLQSELGPEFDEIRKPLQDLTTLGGLNTLRNLDPKTALTRYLLDNPSPTPPTTMPSSRDIP
jgi:sec-independent protein translocase protein TatB